MTASDTDANPGPKKKAPAKARISKGMLRRASRLAAVQAIYRVHLSQCLADEVVDDFRRAGGFVQLEEGAIPSDPELAADIMQGVFTHLGTIEDSISKCLQGQDYGHVEILIKSIMQAGAYEILYRGDIDAPLSISEYLTIARSFYAGNETALVNGVLDRLAKIVRPIDGDA